MNGARQQEQQARRTVEEAERRAQGIVDEARRQAGEAERQARRTVEEAERRARGIVDEARRQAGESRAEGQGVVEEARRQAQQQAHQAEQQARRTVEEAERRARGIMDEARADATQQRERILAEARAQARRIGQEEAQAGPAQNAAGASGGRVRVVIFFLGELMAATGGFSDAQRVGGGGFGSVYIASVRGLGDEMVVLAVKKLDLDSMQGQEEFLQEVQVLGACRHENILPLLGFSADRAAGQQGGVCLVTPLMKGGSLEDRLFLDAGLSPSLPPSLPPFLPLSSLVSRA